MAKKATSEYKDELASKVEKKISIEKSEIVELESKVKELESFYNVLVSRQVFSLPSISVKEPPFEGYALKIAQSVPNAICAMPIVVYSIIIFHDIFLTLDQGRAIDEMQTVILLFYSVIFFFVIIFIAIKCFQKWKEVDSIWDKTWIAITEYKDFVKSIRK
ncbi:MAG: hypothetical protein IT258_16615 [Saprospiraceae bacterium]|nr:hypothetical protein [Saprospiraceae bacterium]